MFPHLGPMELMIVMGIAVLLFGKRLPEVGRSLGRGLRDFRNAMSGEDTHDEVLTQNSAEETAKPASEPAEHPG